MYRSQDNPLAISPGELRHVVQIQASAMVATARGQAVNASSWTTVLTTYAKIEGTSSRTFRESFSNNSLVSQATDVITIRWPGAAIDIKTGMRVIFGDATYLIQAVDNVLRRNRKVVLACVQVSSASN
jgi:head-tail adaptor